MQRILLTLLFAAPLLAAAAPAEAENAVVASVNGKPIVLSEVLMMTAGEERALEPLYQGAERYDRVLKIRREALNRIIDRKLLVEAYEKAPFRFPAQELERGLDALSENVGVRTRREFAARLRAEGVTLEQVRQQVNEQLMAQVMLMQQYKIRVYVAPRDVRAYFDAHPEEFGEPERWQMTLLELPDDEAARQTMLDELQKNPAAFAELTKNAAPHTVRKAGLRPEWLAATGEAPEAGKICGPVETGGKFRCFRIDAVFPAETPDFRAVEPELRERMERDARKAAAEEYLQELRDNAIIRLMLEEGDHGF